LQLVNNLERERERERESGNVSYMDMKSKFYMGIYLNKWSGELQLEIKEGCVHGTWMPPLLTNSWIFSYLIKAYFVLHKGHNSEISKVKLMEIELDLPLVILNNITKFAFDLVE
jgi:hypothetical protein